MAGKKNRKVDVLTHRSGVTVDIYFDPNPGGDNGLKFLASVGDKRFINGDALKLKQEILGYLNTSLDLVWHPVIRVAEVAPFSPGMSSFIGFEVERMHLTVNHAGKVLQLRWDDFDGHNSLELLHRSTGLYIGINRLPEDLPFADEKGDRHWRYLPYDESLYQGLLQIGVAIDKLKDRLRELLKTPQGFAQIAEFGQRFSNLLPEKTR